MRKSRLLLLLSFVSLGGTALACWEPPVCTVKDPTGTPLNVRKAAGGPIIATIRNGQKVAVLDHVTHRDQRWAQVALDRTGADAGWVFKDYLRCGPVDPNGGRHDCVVTDPTGTPLNLRAKPNGKIVGTFPNNERVFPDEEETHNGKTWIRVMRFSEANPIGFVFDAYLKCEEDEQS